MNSNNLSNELNNINSSSSIGNAQLNNSNLIPNDRGISIDYRNKQNNIIGNIDNIDNIDNDEDNQENIFDEEVDAGRIVNDKGEIEDSSTKKAVTATTRGALAYATGGSSIGKDKVIAEKKPVNKLIGVVSDNLEKVPGVEKKAKELDEAGISDDVNHTLDAVGAAKNGDINGAIESGENLEKDKNKLKKSMMKKVLVIFVPVLLFFGMIFLLIGVIAGPSIGGFMGATSSQGENNNGDSLSNSTTTSDSSVWFNDGSPEKIDEVLNNIGFDPNGLSVDRINIVRAGVSAFGTPYGWGIDAIGPGLSGIQSGGFDCSGYVQWMMWTVFGNKDATFDWTGAMKDSEGKTLIRVSENELKPGDVGINSYSISQGHTGVYAGNGWWIHTNGDGVKPARAEQTSQFVNYFRYYKVDDTKIYQAVSSVDVSEDKKEGAA